MDVDLNDTALVFAGGIGSATTAVMHGILTQRLMVRPIEKAFAADARISDPIKRLVPVLLHLSTVS